MVDGGEGSRTEDRTESRSTAKTRWLGLAGRLSKALLLGVQVAGETESATDSTAGGGTG